MSERDDKYPNLRRVITGHDEQGRSIAMIDELINFQGAGTDGWRFQDIWAHRTLPAPIDPTEEDPTTRPPDMAMLEHGMFCRISDIPPTPPGTKPYMHRTNSIDYLHVLEGEVTMLLSDGVEPVILRKGDTILQRATDHAWVNHTDKHCRLFIVMIAGRATEKLENLIGPVPLWDPAGRARAEAEQD
jgi:hypothetical protein